MVREDLPGVYLNRARHHNMMRSKYVVVSLVSVVYPIRSDHRP